MCARGCADLPQCATVTPGGVCSQKCSLPQFPADTGRRLMAWVGATWTTRRIATLMNQFADAVAQHGIVFSTDVQWVTQWTHLNSTDRSELTALLARQLRRDSPDEHVQPQPHSGDGLLGSLRHTHHP